MKAVQLSQINKSQVGRLGIGGWQDYVRYRRSIRQQIGNRMAPIPHKTREHRRRKLCFFLYAFNA